MARFKSNIPAVKKAVAKARDAAVKDALEHVLETSNRTAPIEETTLIRSGDTDVEDGEGTVSYDTPYAAVQHERTDFKHDPGRRAKWLELTVKEEAMTVRRVLAEGMRRRLK